MQTDATLLIVDDERATRDGLRMALEDSFDCYVASDIREAMNLLNQEPMQVVLTDLRMGSDNGMDLLDEILKLPNPPIAIMMTAYGSVDTAVEAMRRGAWDFITKPLNIDEVELMIKRALRTRKLESQNLALSQENNQLKDALKHSNPQGKLIGNSMVMQAVKRSIEQIAPSKATIMIEGESGTGKEVVANEIHRLSKRPKNTIVTVNCAALSPQLLESELFGHEKGAFTGATTKRIGRFEQANGGTIFLDEIGEIDAATQVKLLRVLSERNIERVGSSTSIPVDVRVITATNKNLAQLVQDGSFREDLFFRLNVVPIQLPALRERRDDVPLLAHAFLKQLAHENDKAIDRIDEDAMLALIAYPWPGNVRELRAAIEHGVVMCNTNSISRQNLPWQIQQFAQQSAPVIDINDDTKHSEAHPAPALGVEKSPLAASNTFNLHEIELSTIQAALRQTQNNRTEAAELLGISRRTLQRKIKQHQL
ncbi:sigma-54-dependent transcriptional regulator [Rubritalea marina]|uniref:sigma-54-dependent transcriptional regulator n=1 Tax=Rubritalea marina TaxID=361055 RepID=UPI000376147D|nr:sigma-54 dependent transcriptional regulator [Rubritalea marina]